MPNPSIEPTTDTPRRRGRPAAPASTLAKNARGDRRVKVELPTPILKAMEKYAKTHRLAGRNALIALCAMEGWAARVAKEAT